MLEQQAQMSIAAKRKERGLSQSQLAERMREAGLDHWHQNTVSRIENGKQAARRDELAALEAILGPLSPDGVPTVWSLSWRSKDPSASEYLRQAEEGLQQALNAVEGLRRLHGGESDGVDPETP